MSGPKTAWILKGPSHFSVSFWLSYCNLRFLDSNHTLSPIWNGLNLLVIFCNICCLANSWAACALSRVQWRDSNQSFTAGKLVF